MIIALLQKFIEDLNNMSSIVDSNDPTIPTAYPYFYKKIIQFKNKLKNIGNTSIRVSTVKRSSV
jgi:hypothetical protein